ncbi:MAG: acetyltransferase [Chitinophagaceae bacterium]|nr:acetyltransferase [Chitinophagaceae bacterium]
MNKFNLLVIGCGNVGAFVAYNFKDFQLDDFVMQGFIDDDQEKWDKNLFGYPVLGGVDKIVHLQEKTGVVVTIANPVIKKKIIDKLLPNKNIIFPSLVSRHSWISTHVFIGNGVIIYPGVSINYHTRVEDFVIINMNSAIGHDCHIQRFSALAPGVALGGFTNIGECVDMGIHSATRQSVKIGKHSVVGGMAMVVKDLPDSVTAVGVPAKIVKTKKA